MYVGLFIVSLGVLLKVLDWFIDFVEQIGLLLGVLFFIIGVIIVVFGIFLLELAIFIVFVLSGELEIVIGNVVGFNIINIVLVLGLVVLVVDKIELEYNIWYVDMFFFWGFVFLLWFVFRDLYFLFFEGILFIMGIVVFLAYSFKSEQEFEEIECFIVIWKIYIMFIVGGVFVYFGVDYIILAICKLFIFVGIDLEIIVLFVVALGIFLLEVIVSFNVVCWGKVFIVVGNVLGFNIFNMYIVMGIFFFFGKLVIFININELFLFFMVAMMILFGIMFNNKKIICWEGVLFLMFYVFFFGQFIEFVI